MSSTKYGMRVTRPMSGVRCPVSALARAYTRQLQSTPQSRDQRPESRADKFQLATLNLKLET